MRALDGGRIHRDQFHALAVAINNRHQHPECRDTQRPGGLPVSTTSALAPLIRLSYMRMVVMALPYTVTMTLTGLLAVTYLKLPHDLVAPSAESVRNHHHSLKVIWVGKKYFAARRLTPAKPRADS